jgi:hypothetical protein
LLTDASREVGWIKKWWKEKIVGVGYKYQIEHGGVVKFRLYGLDT